MNDLLPCPFCGGEAELAGDRETNEHIVFCKPCGAQEAYHKTKAEAIIAWNRRAPDPRLAEADKLLERAEKALWHYSGHRETYNEMESVHKDIRAYREGRKV